MSARGIHTLPVRGISEDWITPRHVIDALGPFDLDPCASRRQPWPCAAQSFTEDDDGLSRDWFGRVWLNPPYGSETGRWLRKLAAHGSGIALVPARTETRWFFAEVWDKAFAVLFLEGRLSFHRPDGSLGSGNSGHSSVLVAYGNPDADVLRMGDIPGAFVPVWNTFAADPTKGESE